MNLIDKDKVAAEIKKYKHKADKRLKIKGRTLDEAGEDLALINLCDKLLHFLDTIETKEYDLEKELEKLDRILYDLDGVAIVGATHYLTVEDVKDIAKRFYEMGLNARKEE